jgi:hypothetical protein
VPGAEAFVYDPAQSCRSLRKQDDGIAAGKGWGDFDVQSDFGINIPTGDFHKLGTPLLINTAFQYRVLKVVWPQVEVNYTPEIL